MKIIIPIKTTCLLTLTLFITSCASVYIKGDLANKNLSKNTIPIQISKLEEFANPKKIVPFLYERGHNNLLKSLKDPAGKVVPKEEYTLIIEYYVTDPTDEFIFSTSVLTLGIIPFHSSSDIEADIRILRGYKCVYKTIIKSQVHLRYGWWGFLFLKDPPPDSNRSFFIMNTDYPKIKIIRDRIERRISKLMEDKTVYDKIMPKEQTPSKCSQK